MISVSLQSNARGKIRNFIQHIRARPQVMDVYLLAGADDFILHVAARDTEDLRSFVVENLNADADVAGSQTTLIFEHLRGAAPICRQSPLRAGAEYPLARRRTLRLVTL